MIKNNPFLLDDLNDYFRLIELQRDISVRLQLIVESAKRKNEQLEKVKGLAQTLYNLKHKLRVEKKELKFTPEERKQINKLLFDRHITL